MLPAGGVLPFPGPVLLLNTIEHPADASVVALEESDDSPQLAVSDRAIGFVHRVDLIIHRSSSRAAIRRSAAASAR